MRIHARREVVLDLQQLTNTVEDARTRGTRGVEVLYSEASGRRVEVDRTRATELSAVGSTSLTVRVWLEGGRRAERSGAPGSVTKLLVAAIKAAAKMAEDPFEGPVGRLQTVVGGLGIRDRRYEQLTDEDRAEVVTAAERCVRQADRRLTTSGFEYQDRLEVRRFVNSKGVALEEWNTTYFAEGVVHGPGTEAIRLSNRIGSRSFASIASLPFGTVLARRAVALLKGGGSLPTGPVRVLLPSRCTASLVAALGAGFDHQCLREGGFFLAPEGPGVDTRLHLVDDGGLSGGLATRSFDDRGCAPVALTLLREGKVDGRFVGPADARRHEVRPTGHVRDQALRPNNLVLKSGTRSVNATLSDLDGTVLMVDFLDPAAINTKTGHIEATVDGVIMQSNRVAGSIRGATLSGELIQVLNSVVEICSDTDRTLHVDAPAMIVDGFELG